MHVVEELVSALEVSHLVQGCTCAPVIQNLNDSSSGSPLRKPYLRKVICYIPPHVRNKGADGGGIGNRLSASS